MLRALLRQERESAGITTRKLSKSLGKDETYVSRIERGERTIDLVEFLDLVDKLGADPKALFGEFVDRVRSMS